MLTVTLSSRLIKHNITSLLILHHMVSLIIGTYYVKNWFGIAFCYTLSTYITFNSFQPLSHHKEQYRREKRELSAKVTLLLLVSQFFDSRHKNLPLYILDISWRCRDRGICHSPVWINNSSIGNQKKNNKKYWISFTIDYFFPL